MEKVAFVIRGETCHMVPGHIVLDKGDQIRFSVNGKCKKVTIMFPDGSIFQPALTGPVILDGNSPAGQNQLLHIDAHASEGVYRFAAYCHDTNSFAIGGSDGEIIIQT